jgi:hypothetical protein
MDSIIEFGLDFTDDFSMACVINDLKQEEVLQFFINRTSIYAFNGGDMETMSLYATSVFIECKNALHIEPTPVAERRIQLMSLKYITLLSDLIHDESRSKVEKMRKSFEIMREWDREMSPYTAYAKIFQIDDSRFLLLTFEFNLLCKFNGLTPKQVLQHFINNISIAKDRAQNLLGYVHTNASVSLLILLALSRSMNKSWQPVKMDIYNWYADRLVDLDNSLKEESSVEERLNVYNAFYSEWYQTLINNIN